MFPSNIIQRNCLVKVKLSYVLNIVLVYLFVAYSENIKKGTRKFSCPFMRSKHSLVVFVVPSLGRPVVISIPGVIVRRLVVIIIPGSFWLRRLTVVIAVVPIWIWC